MQKTTTKSISTISYNTRRFLNLKLKELVNSNIIVSYAFIRHKAEEGEKKPHFHLFIEPNGKIDLVTFRKEFLEPCRTSAIPLGVQPFNITNNYEEWYLYGLHHPVYLKAKGLEKKYHYAEKSMTFSDEEYFYEKNSNINMTKYDKDLQIMEAINEGSSKYELLKSGKLTFRELGMYNYAIDVYWKGIQESKREFQSLNDDEEDIF